MRRGFAAACLGVLLVAFCASSAAGFDIDQPRTLFGELPFAHLGNGVHEPITADAIKRGMRGAPSNLIAQIQAGVENTDITHHFDSEYHFDSLSVLNHPAELKAAFANVDAHLSRAKGSRAKPFANRNPEFFAPHYGSYRQIVWALRGALLSLAVSCGDCTKTALGARAVEMLAIYLSPLVILNTNPDPHVPTNPRSVFANTRASCGLCGKLWPVSAAFQTLMSRVENASAFAGAQSRLLPTDHPLRDTVQQVRDALRAYRAFQELGHAFHAAQDFFAHTNYVELMGGVRVGQRIRSGTTIPVPQRRADFSLDGMETILGPDRFPKLESGSAAAIWNGEGDYCLGSRYNPLVPDVTFRLPAWLAKLVGSKVISTRPYRGANKKPPRGLNYCHYQTRFWPGLAKDKPGSDGPEVNHSFARQAATDMTTVLWKSFLRTVERPESPPPASGGWTWSGTWSTKWAAGTRTTEMKLTQTAKTVSGTYAWDGGRISATVTSPRRITGSWSEAPSYKPPNDGGGIEFTLEAGGRSFSGRWSYGPLTSGGSGWNGTCVAGPCLKNRS